MVGILTMGILGMVLAILINLFSNKPQVKKEKDTRTLVIILLFLIITKLMFNLN